MRLVELEKYKHRNRQPLIASMYGIDNRHEAQIQAIELAKDKAELANIRTEQGTEVF